MYLALNKQSTNEYLDNYIPMTVSNYTVNIIYDSECDPSHWINLLKQCVFQIFIYMLFGKYWRGFYGDYG